MTLQYNIRAIPTHFDGRQYRSRLEAKWASFFTLLGWKFEYEPIDFGTWSPDFVLFGANGAQVFVEVKPISEFDEAVGKKIVNALPQGREALLVGLAPFYSNDYNHYYCIGWLAETHCDSPRSTGYHWGESPLTWYTANPHFTDFSHAVGSFSGRLTGAYDGGSHGDAKPRVTETEQLWKEAGNSVQWMRRATGKTGV